MTAYPLRILSKLCKGFSGAAQQGMGMPAGLGVAATGSAPMGGMGMSTTYENVWEEGTLIVGMFDAWGSCL